MVLASLDAFSEAGDDAAAAGTIDTTDPETFAERVGQARRTPAGERRAHAERIGKPAVPHHCVLARNEWGDVVGAGSVVVEGDVAGIYDVVTAEAMRRRGHAERVCRNLLAVAATRGARVGYLQVDAANDAARRIYRRLGFADGYSYHYRTPAECAG